MGTDATVSSDRRRASLSVNEGGEAEREINYRRGGFVQRVGVREERLPGGFWTVRERASFQTEDGCNLYGCTPES